MVIASEKFGLAYKIAVLASQLTVLSDDKSNVLRNSFSPCRSFVTHNKL